MGTKETLDILVKARSLIENPKNHIKGIMWDTGPCGDQRFCARGAIYFAGTGTEYITSATTKVCTPADEALKDAAEVLYPNIRELNKDNPHINYASAHILVNNVLGHQATLSVFSYAIAKLRHEIRKDNILITEEVIMMDIGKRIRIGDIPEPVKMSSFTPLPVKVPEQVPVKVK